MHITRELLRNYLEKNFDCNVEEIDDTTKLFSEGLLDSFSVADLLVYLEEQGKFVVEPEEITYENLDTVANILNFVKGKNATTE